MTQKKIPSPSKPPSARKKKPVAEYTPSLSVFFNERRTILVSTATVCLLILVIFHKFIFGQAYYLFTDIGSDSVNAFYPHFIHVNNYLRTEGFPLWSFAQGMGQNIQFISLNDPFYFVIYLFFPNHIAYGIIWMEILKILITALIIYFVLKAWDLEPLIRIIGTLLYTFSSFMIVGGGWYIFSTEVCFFSLLLLGFEQFHLKKSWYIFPGAVALIAANQPFNLYLYGLFLVVYILVRLITTESFKIQSLIKLVLNLLLLSFLGLLMSSFFLWSGVQQLLDSPRVGGSAGYFNKLLAKPVFESGDNVLNFTTILRFFSVDILGNGSEFKGWNNYLEAPLFYIGLLPLILIPQIFAVSSGRKSIFYFILIIVFLVPLIFPWFRSAIWLFTGDYFRGFSFFIAFLILFMSLKALNDMINGKKINLIVLPVTTAVLFFLLFFPWQGSTGLIDKDVRETITGFLVIYTLCLALFYFPKSRQYAALILLIICITEVGLIHYRTLDKRPVITNEEYNKKSGYNDYTVDIVKKIKESDSGFFRIMKNYTSNPAQHTSFNDAKAEGYYSTMMYGSFNQKYYVKFLEDMGIIEKGNELQSRWLPGLIQHPLLHGLASVKYKLIKGPFDKNYNIGFDSLSEIETIKITKNQHFLPLGFTCRSYVPYSIFMKLPPISKEVTLQKAIVTEDADKMEKAGLHRFTPKDSITSYLFTEYFNDMKILKKDTFNMTRFSQNNIKGNITLDSAKILFFSIPYDKGWHAYINGKPVEPQICNIGFMGFLLEPGNYSIELTFLPQYFSLTLWLTLAGIILYSGFLFISFYRKKKGSESPQLNQTI